MVQGHNKKGSQWSKQRWQHHWNRPQWQLEVIALVTKFGSFRCQGSLDCGEIEELEEGPACTRTVILQQRSIFHLTKYVRPQTATA